MKNVSGCNLSSLLASAKQRAGGSLITIYRCRYVQGWLCCRLKELIGIDRSQMIRVVLNDGGACHAFYYVWKHSAERAAWCVSTHWPATKFRHVRLQAETRQQPSRLLFLNARFVEVDFDGQRSGFLTLLRPLHGDGYHGTEVVRVDLVHMLQKLFVSVDTQLQRHK